MKAAIVRAPGQTPSTPTSTSPTPSDGENRVTVSAAAISPLVRGRASGAHYSASGQFPFVAGVDGVGRLEDGQRVYFVLPRAPFGAMAQRTVVASGHCLPLPDDLDDVTAAAIANPGMSSWAPIPSARSSSGGDGAGQWRDRHRRAARGADRQASRRGESHRHRAQSRGARSGRGARRRRDHPARRGWRGARRSLRPQFAAGVDVVIDYLWGTAPSDF